MIEKFNKEYSELIKDEDYKKERDRIISLFSENFQKMDGWQVVVWECVIHQDNLYEVIEMLFTNANRTYNRLLEVCSKSY